MKLHQLIQGSPEWLAYRAQHFNASDAPAMMGCSPYKTRAELLRELHTGIAADVDVATQKRFDNGHRAEALARPLAEEFIGEELYPVTGSEGKLSASFDGLTLADDIVFEHKTASAELRSVMTGEDCGPALPLHYRVQMEQQLMVSGADRALFMATLWGGDDCTFLRHCWYEPDAELRAAGLPATTPAEKETFAGWLDEAQHRIGAQFSAKLDQRHMLDQAGQVDRRFCRFGATGFVHFQHHSSSAQLLNFTCQIGLGARLFFVATHCVRNFSQITCACSRHHRRLVGAVAHIDQRQLTFFEFQSQFAQTHFERLVQSGHAIVVEARGHGAKHGHLFCGHGPGFFVALNLFGHITQGIAGAFAVKLVDGHKLGKVEHVDFFQLAGCAKLGRHHIHGHIYVRHDGGVALANA